MKFIFLEAVQSHGGARKSTLELAKRLLNDNHEVLIVDFWGSCIEFIKEAKSQGLNIAILENSVNPVIINNSSKKLNILINYFFYFFKLLKYRKRMSKLIESFKPDIIFVNNLKTLSVLKKSNNYKIVFFVRTWFAPAQIPFLHKQLYKKIVDVFIAVSQATRHAIYCSGITSIENIFVLPNAINIKLTDELMNNESIYNNWMNSISPDNIVLLHCGGFLPTKGQHVSLEIAKKLKDKNISFKLILVGLVYDGLTSSKYYNDILNKINLYKLNSNVEIYLNRSDVLSFFASSHILLHPTSTEGLPRVVMEAMALKKPVIVNAVGGVTDYILDGFTGYLTNFNSVDDYVEKIIRLKNDKILYEDITKKGYELIKNAYTENNQIKNFNRIFYEINSTDNKI